MTEQNLVCPRCHSTDLYERDCGPDSYDDDISYTSYICKNCGLWYDGWVDKWLIYKDGSNVECWQDTEDDDVIEFAVST